VNPRFLIVPTLSTLSVMALAIAALFGVALLSRAGRGLLDRSLDGRGTGVLGLAWAVSLVATAGSLYLSDGMGLEPCMLCWYQRIAMYPLVIVLGVALLRRDDEVWKTGLPLCAIGAVISGYHVAVQYVPGIEITSCSASSPCSARYLVAYGFVTIPVMAGSGFLLIGALLAAHARTTSGGS